MQCQFNRSGVLCGHCQQGFSAVFGSPRCKQCSNVYLLITMPLAIAGIVLVIILFALNLTVICVMFSTFNLDLGIETSFYNNMTGYAKMWLQLAFPNVNGIDTDYW